MLQEQAKHDAALQSELDAALEKQKQYETDLADVKQEQEKLKKQMETEKEELAKAREDADHNLKAKHKSMLRIELEHKEIKLPEDPDGLETPHGDETPLATSENLDSPSSTGGSGILSPMAGGEQIQDGDADWINQMKIENLEEQMIEQELDYMEDVARVIEEAQDEVEIKKIDLEAKVEKMRQEFEREKEAAIKEFQEQR